MAWEMPGPSTPSNQEAQTPVEEAQQTEDAGQAVLAWLQAKHSAKFYAEAEMAARKALINIFFDGRTEAGTRRFGFQNGHTLKYGQTEKLEFVKLESLPGDLETQIQELESFIRAMGPEASFIADRLIKWTPGVSKSEFEKLDMSNPLHVNIKTAVETHIVTKYNAPNMELEPPKEPKQ